MFWLLTQMWLWVLIGAFFGGLIGWALRSRACRQEVDALLGQRDAALAQASTSSNDDSDAIIQSLQANLSLEKEEVAGLKAKLAVLTNDQQSDDDTSGEGGLTWRNRYLESRVRFLEGKLANVETSPSKSEPIETSEDIQVARLKWRNRYLEGRVAYLEEESSKQQLADDQSDSNEAKVDPNIVPGDASGRPATYKKPRGGKKDDLKRVSGIGPKIEGILNDLGVFHFDQIASWSRKEVEWVDSYLTFKGRIDREEWIPQSKLLAQGKTPPAKKKK